MTREELDSATDEQLNVMAAKVMGWVRRTHNDVMGTTNADLEDDDYWRGKGEQRLDYMDRATGGYTITATATVEDPKP